MKRLLILFLIFLTLTILGVVFFINGLMPVNSSTSLKRFLISEGETANQIGLDLQKEGIIKSAISFRIYSQVTQAAKNIKPGSYDLTSNLWVNEIINKLLAGPTEVWVTIPEGFRREEVAQKYAQSLGLTATSALSFYKEFLNLTNGREGYLFPDTYLVPKDSTASDIVKIMEDNFNKKVNFKVDNNTLILASILERETKSDEERPIVAGILLKRINAGWPIQADATIQFAEATSRCGLQLDCQWWQPATAVDLQTQSPFNTYLNPGLPPSPICNPGLVSIKAAQNPANSDYWYYLHDKDGQIHYAVTLDEQNANISKYLD